VDRRPADGRWGRALTVTWGTFVIDPTKMDARTARFERACEEAEAALRKTNPATRALLARAALNGSAGGGAAPPPPKPPEKDAKR
jgi:hypothetical protein